MTLCGSTRFKDDFYRVQKELTLEGNIVISVGLFGHSGDDEVWTAGTKEMLDDMHFSKIDIVSGNFVSADFRKVTISRFQKLRISRFRKRKFSET